MHLDLWTLGLQAINAGVLIWLLSRFLFRPVRAMIDQRRQAADSVLADAAAIRTKAEAEAADLARQRQGFAETGERILAEAHAQAAADAAAQQAQTGQAITRMRADAATALVRDRAAMQDALTAQATDLAVSIARRLLGRVPEAAVTEALLRDLAVRLAQLPAEERLRLAGAWIEIVTPTPLSEAQQAACTGWLCQALAGGPLSSPPPLVGGGWGEGSVGGGHGPGSDPSGAPSPYPLPQGEGETRSSQPPLSSQPSLSSRPPQPPLPPPSITFHTDPALLAGVELRAPHTLIRNHWQADLERIAQELHSETGHDTRPARVA